MVGMKEIWDAVSKMPCYFVKTYSDDIIHMKCDNLIEAQDMIRMMSVGRYTSWKWGAYPKNEVRGFREGSTKKEIMNDFYWIPEEEE